MPKRKKPKMPPLSVLDKLIYSFLFAIILVISFNISNIPKLVHKSNSLTNNHVFAVTAGTSSLLLLIPTLVIFSISFYFWIVNFEEKRPIFGKKGIIYGEKTRNIYPLFGQQQKPKNRNNLSKNQKSYKHLVFASLSIILALSIAIGALGIYSRYELTDTSIIKYNSLNHVSNQYPLDTVTGIEITAYHHNRYRSSGYYTFSYTFFFDNGKAIPFTYSEFRDLESLKIVDRTLRTVPRKIKGIKNLDALRREYHFNDQDWAIIQDLFSS